MSAADFFFDSNVLLYLASSDALKAARARSLLAGGGTVSVQVLNEFAAVTRRKFRMEWLEIREMLSVIRDNCDVGPLSVETHGRGLDIAERFALRFYDGVIVASAQQAGCRVLWSEDMQNGQRIGKLTIRNPFVRH